MSLSAPDVQTRQLMFTAEPGRRMSALFSVTHDLEEAIALSDRVVVLSAGPACHPIGEFDIDLAAADVQR
jgi:NitT/TauT family transport system ATP-binding protein